MCKLHVSGGAECLVAVAGSGVSGLETQASGHLARLLLMLPYTTLHAM